MCVWDVGPREISTWRYSSQPSEGMTSTASSHRNFESKAVAISVAMVGHACFDAPEVRKMIVEHFAPSPVTGENGIAATCKLWSVSWNRKMMELRRDMVDTITNVLQGGIMASENRQANVSANEMLANLSDVRDVI